MSEEGEVMCAGDLTAEQHGWLLKFEIEATGPLRGPTHRTITLGGVRRWIYGGEGRVGLLGLESGQAWRGTEFHVAADTKVRLERHIKRGVPRQRKADYPAPDEEDRRG